MKKPLFLCVLAVLLGALLGLAALWPAGGASARAAATIRYVATDGGDSGNCATIPGRCRTIQYAVNIAGAGDEIRVAGGTYAPGDTVARIIKDLHLVGGYSPDLNTFDPGAYQTILDAGWNGSVISITNADDVILLHLTLTHGDGTGNYFSTLGCGGGIYVQDTTLHVGHCAITNNVGSMVGGGLGGGLCARDSDVDLGGSLIVSNTASADPSTTLTAYGGGVYVGSGGAHSALLRDNQFLDNVGHVSAQGRGGGIYLNGLTGVEVLTNTFRGNRATTYNATSG